MSAGRSFAFVHVAAATGTAALALAGAPRAARAGGRTADTAGTAAPVDSAARDPRLAFGAGVGTLSFDDGARERFVMVGAQVRLLPGLTFAVHPGFGAASGLPTTGTAGTFAPRSGRVRRRRTSTASTASGVLDLPLELNAEHEFGALPLSPTVSAGYDVLAATGNARTGVGGGESGASFDLGLGVSPTDRVSVGIDAGRYRSGTAWALGTGPVAAWGDATVSIDVVRALSLSLGAGTNLNRASSADAADVANGRTVEGAATLRLRGLPPLTVDARHAYAGTAPRWSVALAVGRVGVPLSTLGRLGGMR